LTADLPGTGGVLRSWPEDFQVEELPLYPFTGDGEHVYFRVRKRGIDTFECVRRVAAATGTAERSFAYAGLKDGRAVTVQWMSASAATEEQIRNVRAPKLEILEVTRHKNRLKLGHLRGNRFSLRIRGAEPGYRPRVEAILDVLVRRGAPNFFGEQRFGTRLNSWKCGQAILRGDYDLFVKHLLGGPSVREKDPYLTEARRLFDEGKLQEAYKKMPIRQRIEKKSLHALIRFEDAERAYFAIPKRMRQMFLSSFQSYLFNRIVANRVQEIDRVREGDLAYLHRNGAVFLVEETETTQPRCRAFEISPSAPVLGTKSILAQGKPGRNELEVLEEERVGPGDFDVGGGLNATGQRRSMRAPLRDVTLDPLDETSYVLRFSLPPGTYATSVMREILKT
jgi:tRNA pseudouridine13 synthase